MLLSFAAGIRCVPSPRSFALLGCPSACGRCLSAATGSSFLHAAQSRLPRSPRRVWQQRVQTSVKMASIEPERIHELNDAKERDGASYVLYWMQSSVRSRYNHALEYAITEANRLNLPLVAMFGIYEKFPDANERHFAFLLEGLQNVQENLKKRKIKLCVLHHSPASVAVKLSEEAAMVVVDRGYLRIICEWMDTLGKECKCRTVQVESNVVVPVETASDKEEVGARTLRRKIHNHWNKFMKEVGSVDVKNSSVDMKVDLKGMQPLDVSDVDAALAKLDVDRRVRRVHTFIGGEDEAAKHLKEFATRRIAEYGKRNEPSLDVGADLSAYLHFGHISPIDAALAVKSQRKKHREEVDSFWEELVVRRELAMNFVWYNKKYDSIECIPNYAKESLKIHEKDKREHVYSYEQLEIGQSHDPYWNAAQIQMVLTGKMHTYMRMYWGKKVLEWTPKPSEAFDTLLKLNNAYELDGRDPNGFTGVAWCFGKHDQGWTERAVFGKVRYMNEKGLERKFDMKAYVAKVEKLKKEFGLSKEKDISTYFNKRKASENGAQSQKEKDDKDDKDDKDGPDDKDKKATRGSKRSKKT